MKHIVYLLLAVAMLAAACGQNQQRTTAYGQPDNPGNAGKGLFSANCTQCHAASRDMTGPKLGGVLARWGGDTTKLIAFVKNPQGTIAASGEGTYPATLYAQWHHMTMPAYPGLTDQEIMSILRHVDKGVDE